MSNSNNRVNYRYEERRGSNKNNVYLVDCIYNKKRYKYTYSIGKYGEENARALASKMADLLTNAIYDKTVDIETITKINNVYEEKDDYIELYSLEYSTSEMHTIIIDKEDYDKIKEYYWGVTNSNKKFDNKYAVTTKNKRSLRLSHIILGLNEVKKHAVRYKNGNTLDNRKCNLEVVDCCYDGTPMSTDTSKTYEVGRIRIDKNAFTLNYLIDKENFIYETKRFEISDYNNMEEAYEAIKKFKKSILEDK